MTGAVHPNVQFVLDGHERLERGDTEAIAMMFQPDIVWHELGSGDLVGTYVGIADVMAFWKEYFAAAGEGFRQDILEVMASDTFVATIVRLSGKKGVLSFEQKAVDIMRMEQGKIAEFWRYYANTEQAREFLAAR